MTKIGGPTALGSPPVIVPKYQGNIRLTTPAAVIFSRRCVSASQQFRRWPVKIKITAKIGEKKTANV